MSLNEQIVKARIFRYDPDQDSGPYYETYEVPYMKDMRVLDVLEYITEELGHDLAYRWFCGVKKCGGCAVTVNGRPTLSCWEPAPREMVVEPLHNFPIIRDLVVDREGYDANLKRIQPYLERRKPYPGFPEPLTPAQMEAAAAMMHCIECLLCVSECPVVKEVGTDFPGPATLVQLARVALDPRDEGERADIALNEAGLEYCVSCYACSDACPNNIPVLEKGIDGLRQKCLAAGKGKLSHHNKVFKDAVITQGLINPVNLFIKAKGVSVISSTPLALKMLARGRLSVDKMMAGILGKESLTVKDIEKIHRVLEERKQ